MLEKGTRISVLGGGSWGTAIVKILTENLPKVCWYVRSEETVNFIKENRHNPKYITDIEFNTEQLLLTSDINEAVEYADILILVIPSAFVHSELSNLKKSISGKTVFSAVKGIIPEQGMVVGEYLNQCHQIHILVPCLLLLIQTFRSLNRKSLCNVHYLHVQNGELESRYQLLQSLLPIV